jgi:hypothetical protein
MKKTKLSPAQEKIVTLMKADPKAYIIGSRFWDFQYLHLSSGKVIYFKRRTREVLVEKKVITEIEANKFVLTNPNQ